jgi:hypothetical protein
MDLLAGNPGLRMLRICSLGYSAARLQRLQRRLGAM